MFVQYFHPVEVWCYQNLLVLTLHLEQVSAHAHVEYILGVETCSQRMTHGFPRKVDTLVMYWSVIARDDDLEDWVEIDSRLCVFDRFLEEGTIMAKISKLLQVCWPIATHIFHKFNWPCSGGHGENYLLSRKHLTDPWSSVLQHFNLLY